MDSVERRVFMAGLRIDFNIVDESERWRELLGLEPRDPIIAGQFLVPAYRKGYLDEALAKGGI